MSKYEYVLHTWGSFFNKENIAKHGFRNNKYHFFDTEEERDDLLKKLKTLEVETKSYHLCTQTMEGYNARLNTIACLTLQHKDKQYDTEVDFGKCYEEENARYMIEEGNYSCDCNRSLFIDRDPKYSMEELECGEEIKLTNLTFRYEDKPTTTD